jgi:hypothetical protein
MIAFVSTLSDKLSFIKFIRIANSPETIFKDIKAGNLIDKCPKNNTFSTLTTTGRVILVF